MSRQVVDAGVPHEVYLAAKAAGINFSKTLTEALIQKLSATTKEKRTAQTRDQIEIYNEAMVVLREKLIHHNLGDKDPSLYAQAQAERLLAAGYFTTASELLSDARKLVRPNI